MRKKYQRIQRNYDGTEPTSRHMTQLIPQVLQSVKGIYSQKGAEVIATWPKVIGSKLASMTEAVSFQEGVLTVRVKNSTLHSLLNQHERIRLLANLRGHFPGLDIKTIYFRIG